MATLNLSIPASGVQSVIAITEDIDLLQMDFDTGNALFERIDDNLVISFNDSSISLENFYGVYNADFVPDFEVDNEIIAGEDFFIAFGDEMYEELMPAAGAAGGTSGNVGSASPASNLEATSNSDPSMNRSAGEGSDGNVGNAGAYGIDGTSFSLSDASALNAGINDLGEALTVRYYKVNEKNDQPKVISSYDIASDRYIQLDDRYLDDDPLIFDPTNTNPNKQLTIDENSDLFKLLNSMAPGQILEVQIVDANNDVYNLQLTGNKEGADYLSSAHFSGHDSILTNVHPQHAQLATHDFAQNGDTLKLGGGRDQVDFDKMTNGTLLTGNAKDSVSVDAMKNGTINTGRGNDDVNLVRMVDGTIEGGRGADDITVERKMTGGTIEGGRGADEITVKTVGVGTTDDRGILITGGQGGDIFTVTNMNGGKIEGGDIVLPGESPADGENIFNKKGELVAEDQFNIRNMNGGQVLGRGGNDFVNVTNMEGGLVHTGNQIDDIYVKNMSGGTVDAGGDADIIEVRNLSDEARILGNDGKDNIYVTNMEGGLVDGGEHRDTIFVKNMSAGAQVLGGDEVGEGDDIDVMNMSGKNTKIDSGDGDDNIFVRNMTDGEVFADNGEDIIRVNNFSGGKIRANNGDDTVTVGTMSGANTKLFGGHGDDDITVRNFNGGEIHGAHGSDDIRVNTMQSGATIYADTDSTDNGNDSVFVKDMQGGEIYTYGGDGSTRYFNTNSGALVDDTHKKAEAFNGDHIRVNNMSGGLIDAGADADVIVVGNMNEDAAKATINAGDGQDTVIVSTDMSGGHIKGGRNDDIFEVKGDVTGGFIEGEGGHDIAIVNGTLSNATLKVNEAEVGTMADGGKITAANVSYERFEVTKEMTGGEIHADMYAGKSLVDRDDIVINKMSGGVVNSDNDKTAGNDYVVIGDANLLMGAEEIANASGDLIGKDSIVYGEDNKKTVDVAIEVDYNNNAEGTGSFTGGAINMGAGDDTVVITGTMSEENAEATINLGADNDTLYVNNMLGGRIDAGDGNDTIHVESLDDATYFKPTDNDYNNVKGGIGSDTISVGTMFNGVIGGSEGNDNIDVTTLHNGYVFGGADNDTITVSNLVGTGAVIDGNSGKDTFVFNSAEGTESIIDLSNEKASDSDGSASIKGFENATGGAGDDTIIGDKNANVLIGGKGEDSLTGGAGADKFLFNADHFTANVNDVVNDFNLAQGDTHNIEQAFAGYKVSYQDMQNGDRVYTVENGTSSQTITLKGYTPNVAPEFSQDKAHTFDEANLTDGSAPNTSALTQSGSFTITDFGGLSSLTIGTLAVDLNKTEAQALNFGSYSLSVTVNHNPDTGEYTIDYDATLLNNDSTGSIELDLVATDSHKAFDTATLTLGVLDEGTGIVSSSISGYEESNVRWIKAIKHKDVTINGQLDVIHEDDLDHYLVDGHKVDFGVPTVIDGRTITIDQDGTYSILYTTRNILRQGDLSFEIKTVTQEGASEPVKLDFSVAEDLVKSALQNDKVNTGDGNDALMYNVATIDAGTSHGMYAENVGQHTQINTNNGNDTVTFSVDSSALAYGMVARGGGENTIDTGSGNDNVVIDVHSDSSGGTGHAYGMFINSPTGATGNTIKTADGEDNVNINATATGKNDDAYGMYARSGVVNYVSKNLIETGADNDTITIQVDSNDKEFGMRAEALAGGEALNKIDSGDGNDMISVEGVISTNGNSNAHNIIDAGTGNDTIRVEIIKNGEILAGTGDDIVSAQSVSSNAKIDGGIGRDTFILNNTDANRIELQPNGEVKIDGTTMDISGFEIIGGGAGDTLIGNDSANTLMGGDGVTITGGQDGGLDTFVFMVDNQDSLVKDVITDYESGELLDLTAYKQAGYDFSVSIESGSTMLTLTDGSDRHEIVLEGFVSTTDIIDIQNQLQDQDFDGGIRII